MMRKLVLVTVSLALCAACAGGQKSDTREIGAAAFLVPDVKVALPRESGHPNATYHQLLDISHGKEEQSVQAVLQFSPGTVSLTGLSTLGLRLFHGSYSGGVLTVEQNVRPGSLPPVNQILLDIMISMSPPEAWKLPQGYEIKDEGEEKRFLYDGDGSMIYRIEYDVVMGNRLPVLIEHKVYGYRIALKYLKLDF